MTALLTIPQFLERQPTRHKPLGEMIDTTGDCWEWTGAKSSTGYGQYRDDGVQIGAHRFVYEALVGPIPDGLQVDHLCKNKGCVNPDHLEIVSSSLNTLRGMGASDSRCKRGHSDRYVYPNGRKTYCKVCAETSRVKHRQQLLQEKQQLEVMLEALRMAADEAAEAVEV